MRYIVNELSPNTKFGFFDERSVPLERETRHLRIHLHQYTSAGGNRRIVRRYIAINMAGFRSQHNPRAHMGTWSIFGLLHALHTASTSAHVPAVRNTPTLLLRLRVLVSGLLCNSSMHLISRYIFRLGLSPEFPRLLQRLAGLDRRFMKINTAARLLRAETTRGDGVPNSRLRDG